MSTKDKESKEPDFPVSVVESSVRYDVIYDPFHRNPLQIVEVGHGIPSVVTWYKGKEYVCDDGMKWRVSHHLIDCVDVFVELNSDLDIILKNGMYNDCYGMIRDWRQSVVRDALKNMLQRRGLSLYVFSQLECDSYPPEAITYYVVDNSRKLDPEKNNLTRWELVTDKSYHHNVLSMFLLGMKELYMDGFVYIGIEVPVYDPPLVPSIDTSTKEPFD